MSETRHCVMVGLMGVGKSTVGAAVAERLGWRFRDSDADIRAETGLTVRELRDRDGVDSMHAREARQLLDGLAALEPSVIAAAASVADVPECLDALRSPDVFVIWLQASPELLAERFASSDDHRPAYGDSTEGFLARQLATRGAALGSVADLSIDVAERTSDEVATIALDGLRSRDVGAVER
jgi:shikimate kinase